MAISLRILLWAHEGAEELLVLYEDRALELVTAHGGQVVSRERGDAGPDSPDEVHVLRFPTEQAFQAFMGDPARLAIGSLRDQAVARTEVVPLDPTE